MIVSFSRLRAWRRCHRLYHYKYERGLEPKRKKVTLLRGSIIHEMLDAHAQGKNPMTVIKRFRKEYGPLVESDPDHYGDLFGECRDIFVRYLDRWAEDGLEVEETEYEVSFTLTPELTFRGIIDKILVDEDGNRWLTDHKTHKVFPDEDARYSDLQLLLYVYAWNRQHPDQPLTGILWDYLRTKPPAIPQVLKSGALSKRANIDTTAEIYLQTIREHGLNPTDYEDILETLEEKGDRFFQRHYLPTPPEKMMLQIVDDVVATGETLGQDAARTMTRECKFCDFYTLCNAELRDYDSEYLLETEFRTREDEDYLLEEEAEAE